MIPFSGPSISLASIKGLLGILGQGEKNFGPELEKLLSRPPLGQGVFLLDPL